MPSRGSQEGNQNMDEQAKAQARQRAEANANLAVADGVITRQEYRDFYQVFDGPANRVYRAKFRRVVRGAIPSNVPRQGTGEFEAWVHSQFP